MCETAAKWIDSRARLQFRFFLNVFNCLLTTNLSRRNNRSRTGPQTLFNFRRNCNRQWISIKFHVYSRYLAATRDVHSTTTGCKWLIFHFTTMMQRNQSAHTACMSRVRVICEERSFLNLFRGSRTPLDLTREKFVTLIYLVIVQCPSVETTWYSARNGYTWATRDFRLPRRTSGSALSADRQTLDVFVIVKVLFRIPQQLIIVKIRK